MHYEGDTALETKHDLARKATIFTHDCTTSFISEGDVFAECLVCWTFLMMCSPSVKYYGFRDGDG